MVTKLKLVAGTTVKSAGRKNSRLRANETKQPMHTGTAQQETITCEAFYPLQPGQGERTVKDIAEQYRGKMQIPDIVALDAVEVAYEALDGYPDTKTNKGLIAVRDVLFAAMVHAGKDGGVSTSRQAFYDRVADLACNTAMTWQCTLTRELLASFEVRAQKGNATAKLITESAKKSGRTGV